jgi:hypothetical protein
MSSAPRSLLNDFFLNILDVGRFLARVVVGAFILWQIVFLFWANAGNIGKDLHGWVDKSRRKPERARIWDWLPKVPSLNKPVEEWLDSPADDMRKTAIGDFLERGERINKQWGQFTGQNQSWSLFAPTVARHISFLALELRWDDPDPPAEGAASGAAVRKPEILLSDNEPPDPYNFFRIGHFRLRRYESNLDVALYLERGESLEQPRVLEEWEDKVRRKLRRDWDCLMPYLKWRLQVFEKRNPDVPKPTQVIILARTYNIPAPPGDEPWHWDMEGPHPIARWLPNRKTEEGYVPVQIYNFSNDRFENLSR